MIYGVAFLETVLSDPAKSWPSWMLFGNETWPEWLMGLYALNPLVGILNAYHAVFFPDNADRCTGAARSLRGALGARIRVRLADLPAARAPCAEGALVAEPAVDAPPAAPIAIEAHEPRYQVPAQPAEEPPILRHPAAGRRAGEGRVLGAEERLVPDRAG